MPRTHNATCKVCNKGMYKRPNQIKSSKNLFCDRECYAKFRRLPEILCKQCNKSFARSHHRVMFCSRQCAQEGRDRTRNKYEFPGKSAPERRLNELRWHYGTDVCMVKGCRYNLTFDIHRLVPGSEGGEYILGNMFAICPNHHAEVHRGIITFKKVNNWTLIKIPTKETP